MSEDVTLAACPFCEGEAELIHGCGGCWYARCTDCQASGDDRDYDRAIAAWNARTPVQRQPSGAEVQRAVVVEIAKAAHAIGWQAGVGGMETAGAIVSYLAQHQDQIEPFFAGTVSPIDWPDFTDGGCLTWHAQKGGKIVHPADVSAAKAKKTHDR